MIPSLGRQPLGSGSGPVKEASAEGRGSGEGRGSKVTLVRGGVVGRVGKKCI